MQRTIILMAILTLFSCTSPTTPVQPEDSSPAQVTSLSVEELLSGSSARRVTLENLGKQSSDGPATILFSGTISFSETTLESNILDQTWVGSGQTLSPTFSVTLISNQEIIIPTERRIISTWRDGNSFWDVIIGAGSVWHGEGDGVWQHALLPIHFVSRKVGQVRNGLLSFFYTENEITQAHIQFDQETCPAYDYQPGNMIGMLSAEYNPFQLPDPQEYFKSHFHAIQNRIPIRPWGDLDRSDLLMNLFNSRLNTLSAQSMGAILKDGTLYLQKPTTRFGEYPFPEEMRHGVFSVTKTLCGALSILYLAERYEDTIFDEFISDYVPDLADHPGWKGVTFEHTLNMVTGTEGTDEGNMIVPFILSSTAESGIQIIAELGDAEPAPGKSFQYASTHTFVLSYALQQYVQKREGTDVNYWELVRKNVLQVIHAGDMAVQVTEEQEGQTGIPILGWGASPTIDEAAKIALLFQNDGQYGDLQLLHRKRTREAMGKTNFNGYPTTNGRIYRHSFWVRTYEADNCIFGVPYMLGYGGNLISFYPSGLITFRFMDQNTHDFSPMANAAETLKTSCKN